MLPAWDTTLLPEGQAAQSTNGYLFSGSCTGWRLPKLLRALTNSAAKFAYRVPVITSAVAGNTLSINVLPLAGDTVKIGEVTYKFVAALVNPFDVLIGVDGNACAINLFAAITLSAGAGTLYGTGTYANMAVDRTTPTTKNSFAISSGGGGFPGGINVVADDPGAAYNGTTTTESTGGARMSWVHPSYVGGVNKSFDSTITGPATWLEFLDQETEVMRSPVVDDKFNRYYFSSPSLAPQYNTYDRIVAGLPAWALGLYPPGVAPAVSVAGGGNQTLLGLPTSTSINDNVPGANTIWVAPITTTGAMSLDSIEIMPASPTTTGKFAAVLYSDNLGAPGTLVSFGGIITGCMTGVPIISQFSQPPGLLNATKYWIGFMTDTAVGFQKANDVGAGGGLQQSNTWTNGPPGIFSGSTATPDFQMWANCTTSSILDVRAYVYTWLSAYGEESPPSPPTLTTGWSNGTWTIKMTPPVPDDMGVVRNITTIRIYRTVSALTGSTVFFWVGDIDIASNSVTTAIDAQATDGTLVSTGTLQVDDTWSGAIIAQNFQLPSTTWFPPEQGVNGIVAMPNGMSVGFRDNEIWFSEPYRPHAWPPGYVITTEFPIVGLGIIGTSVVAATNGAPYAASGVNPGSMTLLKFPESAPCTSRGSILATSEGVYYSSTKGLIKIVTTGPMVNTTEMWITRDKWAQLTPQKNLLAVMQSSCYFAFGTIGADGDASQAQNGFTIELNAADSSSFTIWPQPGGHRIGFSQLTAPNGQDIANIINDPWTGITMLLQQGNINYYDFTDAVPTIQPYIWTSKVYQQKFKDNLAAMRVFFSIPPGTPAQNAKRNEAAADDGSWSTLDPGQYGIISVYGDGNLVTTRELVSSGELLRINSGQKYEFWQVRVNARVDISNIQMAPTVKELRGV
jgi:hypothetical protein